MATEPDGSKLLLGKGKVYFDRFTSAGASTGERYLGDVSAFSVTTNDEKISHYSSSSAAAPLLKEALIRRTAEFALTLHEYTKENLALVLMGEESALAQASDSVVDEVVTVVETGRFYKLAFRQVSTVVVQDDTDTTTYTAGTDYDVDAVTGRLYIIPGGGIAALDVLHVDYDYAADTSDVVQGGKTSVIEGAIRFIPDPSTGPSWEVEVWKVSITPDGELGLIGEQFAAFPIRGKVLDDSVNHPTEPLYRKILRAA